MLIEHSCFSELFDNFMQQDAHEFLNYLLNRVSELLQGEFKTFLNMHNEVTRFYLESQQPYLLGVNFSVLINGSLKG